MTTHLFCHKTEEVGRYVTEHTEEGVAIISMVLYIKLRLDLTPLLFGTHSRLKEYAIISCFRQFSSIAQMSVKYTSNSVIISQVHAYCNIHIVMH